MKTELMQVTPKMAHTWLASNRSNRKLRESHVQYLAREMSSGHWRLTHQGIAFSEDGMLIDGQHRLAAIELSGKAISIPVTFDVPSNNGEFIIIDRGLSRTVGDILGVQPANIAVYNALLNISANNDKKRSPDDVKKLHLSIAGRITQRLVTYAPTTTRLFGSASFKAAAVVTVAYGKSDEYVFDLYRNFVLNDIDKLPTVGAAALKMVLRENWLGHYRPISSIFSLGMYVLSESNSSKTRIKITTSMRTEYIALCKDFINTCLVE